MNLIIQTLCASLCTYAIKHSTGTSAQQAVKNYMSADNIAYGLQAKLINDIDIFIAGPGNIDACYLGETNEHFILAFRGTSISTNNSLQDWVNDCLYSPINYKNIPGKLHIGFLSSVERLFHQGIMQKLSRRMQVNPKKKIIITGYSKGAALAPLAAAFLDKIYHIDPAHIEVNIFEPPKAGNQAFARYFNQTFPTSIRYEYQDDIVPHLPPPQRLINILKLVVHSIPSADYYPVGRLSFVNWHNDIERHSYKLTEQRLHHIKKLLLASKSKKLINDHHPGQHLYKALKALCLHHNSVEINKSKDVSMA